jgi:hypothetical protein
MTLYIQIVTTYSVYCLKHNISTLCEVKTCLFYIYKHCRNPTGTDFDELNSSLRNEQG